MGRPRSLFVRTQRRNESFGWQLRRLADVEHLPGIPQQLDTPVVLASRALAGEPQGRLAGALGPLPTGMIGDPPDLVEDQRWPLGIYAAVDRRLGHAVGFLAPAAEPIEHGHQHGLAAAPGRRCDRQIRRDIEALERPGVERPERQRSAGMFGQYDIALE